MLMWDKYENNIILLYSLRHYPCFTYSLYEPNHSSIQPQRELQKTRPSRFQAPCKFVQWYLQKAGCLCSERREASCRGCFRFGIAGIMSCFSHAVIHPIVRAYSMSFHSYQKKQDKLLMIVSYHKRCPINRTYKTRPTIRNSSSGDAGFGAYALL